jgi:hypothetical protein
MTAKIIGFLHSIRPRFVLPRLIIIQQNVRLKFKMCFLNSISLLVWQFQAIYRLSDTGAVKFSETQNPSKILKPNNSSLLEQTKTYKAGETNNKPILRELISTTATVYKRVSNGRNFRIPHRRTLS